MPAEVAANGDAATNPSATKCCSHDSQPKVDPQRHSTGTELILAAHAQRCQGLVTFWITAGAVLPLTPAPVIFTAAPPVGWQATVDSLLISAVLSPPDPPPRLAA